MVPKQEIVSSKKLQHYDVTSCKQRHLIEKHYWCKGVSFCYNHRKFEKVFFINEGVMAFSKKVHVFFETPCRVLRTYSKLCINQGSVVQTIISLTTSLRGQLVKCLTTAIPNTLIFFVEKTFTFFQQKILAYLRY